MAETKEKIADGQPDRRTRDSGLELFRIILMFFIVAHHYVVHSGIMELAAQDPFSFASVCVAVIGAWGKTGIDCFVLITGYFMCRSQFKPKKFFALLFEAQFYGVLFFAVFTATGYQAFSWTALIEAILPFSQINQNFTGCFLIFYLTVPFLNVLVQNLGKRMHKLLIALSLGVYCILGAVFYSSFSMNYVGWFIVLYFVASYLRLYPCELFSRKRIWGAALAAMLLLSIASMVLFAYIVQTVEGLPRVSVALFALLAEVNIPFAFLTAFCAFLFFKNIHFQNAAVNRIASTTFGVFLIHDNCASMRQFLWQDVLHVTAHYGNFVLLYALPSVAAVFLVCALSDLLRQTLLVRPLRWLMRKLRRPKAAPDA